ncbi:carbohydrate ABC transporter substrate-binding protein [Paenibacillus mesophilus]|uniref:ABC transporter substrate-binding protein n=1 Tax=Paenibacillus mesophilus TaxID=2582849 RepID=UPI00110D622D|nr:ABC transporter substrate-binding protein [Paenibacillus mesophilus]TMV49088.1 carbohydrate ABC transporter substrate-binding protein [Paenibacillus mesophilus]
MKTYMKKGMVMLPLVALLAACGSQSGSNSPDSKASEPPAANKAADINEKFKETVTVNFFYNGYSGSLMDEWKAKIKEKYNIELNPYMKETIESLIASGVKLDLIAYSAGGLFKALDLQLTSDMSDMIAKYKFDLNRLAPGVLESARMYSGKGEVPVMPYELNNNVLIYNKNIFDKFGVAYPKDGMTWDQMSDLIKKVARTEGGVQYRGYAYSGLNLIYKNQMGLTFVDPNTNKATINTDSWKKWLDTMAGFYKINNNDIVNAKEDDLFFKEQTLAMRGGPSPLELLPAAIEKGLGWDAVSNPRFTGMENAGGQMNAPFLAIPPSSQQRDAAFKVISFFLSDEMQAENARAGRVPVLKSEAVVKEFGTKLPFLKGTNYAKAVFADTIGKPILVTKFDGTVRSQLSVAIVDVATGKKDVNTALRDAEENSNKAIEAAIKK